MTLIKIGDRLTFLPSHQHLVFVRDCSFVVRDAQPPKGQTEHRHSLMPHFPDLHQLHPQVTITVLPLMSRIRGCPIIASADISNRRQLYCYYYFLVHTHKHTNYLPINRAERCPRHRPVARKGNEGVRKTINVRGRWPWCDFLQDINI